MKPEPDEYALALQAKAGDRAALAALVERTRLRLFALAYAELRHYEDAQDAVAAALFQICRHVGELREPGRVREWMNAIVRNEVRRHRRGRSATLPLEEADAAVDDDRLSLLWLDIDRALRQLPGDQAEVSRLFYLEDLPIAEIARRLDRPEGTVKSWLHRGRRRLALEMEGYAPMTPTPKSAPEPTPGQAERPLPAAIIHTDLDPALLQKVMEVLRAAGYDTREVQLRAPSLDVFPTLRDCQLLVVDEWLEGRSAIEFLLNKRGHSDTKEIPLCLLCSDLSMFTISAYNSAGVKRLVYKADPDSLERIGEPYEKEKHGGGWSLFTERARRVVYFAQEEAAQRGEKCVDTEHLLLGITREPESAGAKILDRLGISLQSVRDEIVSQIATNNVNLRRDMQLAPSGKKVVDLAFEEARLLRNDYLGIEHLLLGLLGEREGLAARVLNKLGVDLERARAEVWAMQER
jgi:RNA polymerase sigma factor (sigma-70 family)